MGHNQLFSNTIQIQHRLAWVVLMAMESVSLRLYSDAYPSEYKRRDTDSIGTMAWPMHGELTLKKK